MRILRDVREKQHMKTSFSIQTEDDAAERQCSTDIHMNVNETMEVFITECDEKQEQ